ncbi:2-dehydro-3-deoxyphosphogluconate aldolase/(4S)-4-hydroxy-2-oxoglutarate aldolase [Rhodothalassium salexigens DSM 2132]|uniref:2-dehydro-3-deoxy-phosphogluconate aldolase n=1 Tax=Rhodothalassium salexigens DSM 2132 TaxID=1188247 RepID=A0A4R2PPG3_RHOSA|nr:bifunctional 4-hydroxy-2-oxoglutarate aldolase/2-dehydro-3-deoxy-phosphogluconate aldolase [Rhodothalassium salexigens]MBB4210805.1 2-dehydro-3-deoxyphosphogluconate aldolase/(4S)-4-hydroxy-2-oxoglutarate aldolase [Rhodothalassium salexigens DSM 2132]TCP37640.1 2-dehydro-3-deoxyphosphogluconate aldolase/(4S)-4-hydroxy-2-oxoglutarate aldolase [Rhodothalassium salexigens DSM 2132]
MPAPAPPPKPALKLSAGEVLNRCPVIPVLTVERTADAAPLARALVAGGLSVLEVTLRTPVAERAITAMRAAVPDALVGAGTVLTPADLDRAQRAGAQFVVSPGLTPALEAAARTAPVALIPGVATAGEMMKAADAGFAHLKFFPAAAAGGVAALQALAGPLPGVRLCPTGGIGPDSLADYLSVATVACVGGSWMVPKAALDAGDFQRITALAADAVARAEAAPGPGRRRPT